MRGETVTIVGLAAWIRPVPAKESAVLRLRIAARLRWIAEQERERLINAVNEQAEREERARRWFGEKPAAEADDELPPILQEQAV